MTAPPIIGAELWHAVTGRAAGRCECTGQCGHKHSQARRPAARTRLGAGEPDGRCLAEQYPGRAKTVLHVVPAEPMDELAAMLCDDPAAFTALCDPCHARVLTRRAKAERAAERARAANHPCLFSPTERITS